MASIIHTIRLWRCCMRMMRIIRRTYFLLLFIIFCMAGCSAFNPDAADPTTIPYQQTSEPSSTLVGAPIHEEILPTLGKLPTSILPLPTPTNLPTLSANEARAFMLDLVRNNADCRTRTLYLLQFE